LGIAILKTLAIPGTVVGGWAFSMSITRVSPGETRLLEPVDPTYAISSQTICKEYSVWFSSRNANVPPDGTNVTRMRLSA
jgi:hypothetical protein